MMNVVFIFALFFIGDLVYKTMMGQDDDVNKPANEPDHIGLSEPQGYPLKDSIQDQVVYADDD